VVDSPGVGIRLAAVCSCLCRYAAADNRLESGDGDEGDENEREWGNFGAPLTRARWPPKAVGPHPPLSIDHPFLIR
jgi:hypothetical protein